MDPHVNMHENVAADVAAAEILKVLNSRLSTLEQRLHLFEGPRKSTESWNPKPLSSHGLVNVKNSDFTNAAQVTLTHSLLLLTQELISSTKREILEISSLTPVEETPSPRKERHTKHKSSAPLPQLRVGETSGDKSPLSAGIASSRGRSARGTRKDELTWLQQLRNRM